jgi:SAM-dependent methyltransferase
MIAENQFCSGNITGPSIRQMADMNFFVYPTAAKRYANGRPFFHPLAIKKIKEVCCENGRIDRALDVGCGTGQSTQALLEVDIKGFKNFILPGRRVGLAPIISGSACVSCDYWKWRSGPRT